MAGRRALGGAWVGSDLGGAQPKIRVSCEVALPRWPLLRHGLFLEEARGRDHAERRSIEGGRRVGGGGARRPAEHGDTGRGMAGGGERWGDGIGSTVLQAFFFLFLAHTDLIDLSRGLWAEYAKTQGPFCKITSPLIFP